MISLKDNIEILKGIGKIKSLSYAKLGIRTIGDFLYFFPRDYQNRTIIKNISDTEPGEMTAVKANVIKVSKTPYIRNHKSMLKVRVSDGFQVMDIIYFNANYLANNFIPGEEYYFYGKVGKNSAIKQMIHPEYSKEEMGIVPIYHLTQGITQKEIRKRISSVIDLAYEIKEYMPSHVMEKHNLADINFAIKNIHFPTNIDNLNIAKKRIIYDELFFLELGLFMMKTVKGIGNSLTAKTDEFIESLPYELTKAQAKVVREIEKDMESDMAMSRLLQGDVGSGKTAVAEIAMYKAVKSGYQGAFMAPTDVLVKQHYANLKRNFEPYGINVDYLSGHMKKAEKNAVLERLKLGETDIAIGTHALIQDNVEFQNLGLVVTDEQHRFGVSQRRLLNEKGASPDVLIMTATPIPRTLAMVIYGDTDFSVIDELPPGRKNIITKCVLSKAENKIYSIVLDEIQKGRQVYVVAPLIEESEMIEAKSATQLYDELRKKFKGYRIGLLHGAMNSEEKEEIMAKFAEGEIKLLVSTVVIEVGIDVPNASVMVIENCERFGLAQMHQLRGRVGRGNQQSYCFLIMGKTGEVAIERAKVMCESNDGFLIAEKDLDLRGPGDVFGTVQHGIMDTHLTEMVKHMDVMEELRDTVIDILKADPNLLTPGNYEIRQRVEHLLGQNIRFEL